MNYHYLFALVLGLMMACGTEDQGSESPAQSVTNGDPRISAQIGTALGDGMTLTGQPGVALTGAELHFTLYRDYRGVVPDKKVKGRGYRSYCVEPLAPETEIGTLRCGGRDETKVPLVAAQVGQVCTLRPLETVAATKQLDISCKEGEQVDVVPRVSTPSLCLRNGKSP